MDIVRAHTQARLLGYIVGTWVLEVSGKRVYYEKKQASMTHQPHHGTVVALSFQHTALDCVLPSFE